MVVVVVVVVGFWIVYCIVRRTHSLVASNDCILFF